MLTKAALAGQRDMLAGLKENVILGHLVPAGTGARKYLGLQVKKIPEFTIPKGEEIPENNPSA